jgi:hypothetical protein
VAVISPEHPFWARSGLITDLLITDYSVPNRGQEPKKLTKFLDFTGKERWADPFAVIFMGCQVVSCDVIGVYTRNAAAIPKKVVGPGVRTLCLLSSA